MSVGYGVARPLLGEEAGPTRAQGGPAALGNAKPEQQAGGEARGGTEYDLESRSFGPSRLQRAEQGEERAWWAERTDLSPGRSSVLSVQVDAQW